MRIEVHNRTSDFASYRAARTKSLFNAESGCNFDLEADLPIDDPDWKIGLIVGPSGSGKTSMGRQLWGGDKIYNPEVVGWPHDKPIVDVIAPEGDFNAVTAALAAVGLGSVPSWLRPYHVLSNGEKFRADLARIIAEAPEKVIVDEFTSVVDRQIARMGALAFQKSWRRTKGQCILLSCHYDIIDWVEPDWVFDTSTGVYSGRGLWRRPRFDVEIWETDWRYWDHFKPHYYLDLPKMVAARCYVGTVDGELVAHVAVGTKNVGKLVEARASRMVVMPEWQGAGVGLRFLNAVADLQMQGKGRLPGRNITTIFHTSHPGLCAGLRRDPKWVQVSASLYGGNKLKSAQTMARSALDDAGVAGKPGRRGSDLRGAIETRMAELRQYLEIEKAGAMKPGRRPIGGVKGARAELAKLELELATLNGDTRAARKLNHEAAKAAHADEGIDAPFPQQREQVTGTGFGGHFRAIQGFRYLGENRVQKEKK